MAKAKVDTVAVQTVTLELTIAEAQAIEVLSDHIGGRPDGPRGLFNGVTQALREANVYAEGVYFVREGNIYIEDTRHE